MAIIKCKMCGGDLTLMEGQSVAECEYCGSRQTAAAVGGKGDEESGRCNVGGWTNLKLPDSFERQTILGLA